MWYLIVPFSDLCCLSYVTGSFIINMFAVVPGFFQNKVINRGAGLSAVLGQLMAQRETKLMQHHKSHLKLNEECKKLSNKASTPKIES